MAERYPATVVDVVPAAAEPTKAEDDEDDEDEGWVDPLTAFRAKLTVPGGPDECEAMEWVSVWGLEPPQHEDAPTLGAWIAWQAYWNNAIWPEEETRLLNLAQSPNVADRIEAEVGCLLCELRRRYGVEMPKSVGASIQRVLMKAVEKPAGAGNEQPGVKADSATPHP
jgi:hypothetical protein